MIDFIPQGPAKNPEQLKQEFLQKAYVIIRREFVAAYNSKILATINELAHEFGLSPAIQITAKLQLGPYDGKDGSHLEHKGETLGSGEGLHRSQLDMSEKFYEQAGSLITDALTDTYNYIIRPELNDLMHEYYISAGFLLGIGFSLGEYDGKDMVPMQESDIQILVE